MYIQQKDTNGKIKSVPYDEQARKYFMIDFVNEIEDTNLMQVSNSRYTLPANSFCTSKNIPKSLGNMTVICAPDGFQYIRKD